LLIHEGQLTYESEGLKKIVDLGEWWADRTGGLPLPLGGNVIRRDLGSHVSPVSHMLHDSIAYALHHRQEAVEYSMQFGRGLDRARTDRFVGMYVNGLTLDYGDRGRQAVTRLMGDAEAAGLVPPVPRGICVVDESCVACAASAGLPRAFQSADVELNRVQALSVTGFQPIESCAKGPGRHLRPVEEIPELLLELLRDDIEVTFQLVDAPGELPAQSRFRGCQVSTQRGGLGRQVPPQLIARSRRVAGWSGCSRST
jgi:hypothetical protein